MATFKCTAAGDAMVLRRLPGAYPGFQEICDFIQQGDFRFINMETTIHNHETYGAATSGGTWFCSPPGVLEDAKEFGFNILSTCNNHAMDYSHIGLEKTLKYVEDAGFPNAGVGRTLADAAAPVYLDTLAGRIALIGACSSFQADAMAGEQSSTVPGRPGINGIRVSTVYRVPQEEIEHLKRIAEITGINGARDISRREGYLPQMPANKTEFEQLMFEAGEPAGKFTRVNPVDMARVERSIQEARYMADYVIVALLKLLPVHFRIPSTRNLPISASMPVPMPSSEPAPICCVLLRFTRIAPFSILSAISSFSWRISAKHRQICMLRKSWTATQASMCSLTPEMPMVPAAFATRRSCMKQCFLTGRQRMAS